MFICVHLWTKGSTLWGHYPSWDEAFIQSCACKVVQCDLNLRRSKQVAQNNTSITKESIMTHPPGSIHLSIRIQYCSLVCVLSAWQIWAEGRLDWKWKNTFRPTRSTQQMVVDTVKIWRVPHKHHLNKDNRDKEETDDGYYEGNGNDAAVVVWI